MVKDIVKKEKSETIKVTPKTVKLLKNAINASLEFEREIGKQLNITSIVGEVIAAQKCKLKLMRNDINAGYDALDGKNKKIQIKTRRIKDKRSIMTGKLLDKDYNVPFDYALLVLLDMQYEVLAIYKIPKNKIQEYFHDINEKRIKNKKERRKDMPVSTLQRLGKVMYKKENK